MTGLRTHCWREKGKTGFKPQNPIWLQGAKCSLQDGDDASQPAELPESAARHRSQQCGTQAEPSEVNGAQGATWTQ